MLLETPFTEEKIRALHVGDRVEITGLLFTGRDRVHKHLHEGNAPPVSFENGILYHCGPVVVKERGLWVVKAAGPTTSIREEPYQHEVIRKFRVRGVIGKGGMGPKTLAACQEVGCVYLHAVGGAAQVLADRVKTVRGVHWMEFGSPEAVWEFEVERFPAVVTMDSHGGSLHRELLDASGEKLKEMLTALDAE